MKPQAQVALPVRAQVAGGLFASLAALLVAGVALAEQPPSRVVIVEEDWELVIRDPDPDRNAPQVTSVISPTDNLDGAYATFDLNHRSQPYYRPGGMQIQLWDGEDCKSTASHSSAAVAATANETVRWTSRMRLYNGDTLIFSVRNGSSQTWGDFGAYGTLWVSRGTSLASLNAYDPEVSVRHSGVGFAGNRVESLKLLRVRRTLDTGVVLEDNTVRTVTVE